MHKEGKVLEPLADLFKDEVRELGSLMGIKLDCIIEKYLWPNLEEVTSGFSINVEGLLYCGASAFCF